MASDGNFGLSAVSDSPSHPAELSVMEKCRLGTENALSTTDPQQLWRQSRTSNPVLVSIKKKVLCFLLDGACAAVIDGPFRVFPHPDLESPGSGLGSLENDPKPSLILLPPFGPLRC